tara:strand:- start:313 stop:549 length:237 start_codon:yes stop_codon:yes gene_type:complete
MVKMTGGAELASVELALLGALLQPVFLAPDHVQRTIKDGAGDAGQLPSFFCANLELAATHGYISDLHFDDELVTFRLP